MMLAIHVIQTAQKHPWLTTITRALPASEQRVEDITKALWGTWGVAENRLRPD